MDKAVLVLGVMSLGLATACGTSGGGVGGGATTTATGGSTSTGACKKCSAMLSTADTDPTHICAGSSATLYAAVTTCVCQPSVCGSASGGSSNCAAECTTPGTAVSTGCMACDAAKGTTTCQSQLGACNADM